MWAVVWTYSGGVIRPAAQQLAGRPGRLQKKGIALSPTLATGGNAAEFDLSALQSELRAAVEETLKQV